MPGRSLPRATRNALSVHLQRDYNTYLWGALPLCVVLGDRERLPWYHERFVQLYSEYPLSGSEPPHADFLDAYAYTDVLETRTLDRREAGAIGPVVDFLRACTDDGWYCVIFVDDHHLRGRRTPFVHEFLVFGYDDHERQLHAAGFDRHQVFDCLRFGYQAFTEAFERGMTQIASPGPFSFIRSPVQLLRPVVTRASFDPSRLALRLGQYLEASGGATADSPAASWWRALKTHGDWWKGPLPRGDGASLGASLDDVEIKAGLDVYDHLAAHLEQVAGGRHRIDYRLFHLLAEHKRAVLSRTEFVRDRYGLGSELDELIPVLRDVSEKANTLRLLALRQSYGGDHATASEGVRLLPAIRDQERPVLEHFHAVLRGI